MSLRDENKIASIGLFLAAVLVGFDAQPGLGQMEFFPTKLAELHDWPRRGGTSRPSRR